MRISGNLYNEKDIPRIGLQEEHRTRLLNNPLKYANRKKESG
jgi:hypothetical protein